MPTINLLTVNRIFLISAIVVSALTSQLAAAQKPVFTYNTIPLNKSINIRLLGADEQLLQCYNLYGFVYITDEDSISGEFIVPKDADSFHNKDAVFVKLCQVKEFAILIGATCKAITVESGIQLKYPGQKDLVYLNFDPEIPDAVFVPCK